MAKIRPLLERKTGAAMRDILALVGGPRTRSQAYLVRAMRMGELVHVGANRHTVYFLTAEAAEAGAVELAELAEVRRAAALARKNELRRKPKPEAAKAKRRAYDAARYETKVKPARAAKPPKAPKPPKALKLAAPSKPDARAKSVAAFKSQTAHNLALVKVQVLPGFTGAPKWEINGKTWGAR